jgi:S1-C subfamily serine protease
MRPSPRWRILVSGRDERGTEMAETTWAALSNELASTAEAAGKSVVAVLGRRHPSTGVLFREDAVVTASHALRKEDDVVIIAGPGRNIPVRLAGRDPGTDIAVLRLREKLDAPVAKWGTTATLKVGELVLALGRTRRGNVVASAGILSGLIATPWRTWRSGEIDRFIRPDLNFYPGFSGGPLLAHSGEFLGINTVGLHRTGITVPSETVQRVATELLEKGKVERPYLGLGMQAVSLPESLRSKLNLTSSEGLLVVQLEPQATAEKAGVLIGDILIELAGQRVADTDDVQNILGSHKPGQVIQTRLVRAGAITDMKVQLEARP